MAIYNLIQDDFSSFNTSDWTLSGDADYDSSNNSIELATGTESSGAVEWVSGEIPGGEDFEVSGSFNYEAGKESLQLRVSSNSQGDEGYRLRQTYDGSNWVVLLEVVSEGSVVASEKSGALDSNTTPTWTIKKSGSTLSANIGNATDPSNIDLSNVSEIPSGSKVICSLSTGINDATISLTSIDIDGPPVQTDSESNVGESSATLNGSLKSLDGQSSIDVFFEYREVGASTWQNTPVQSLSSTGSFSEEVALKSNTEYEFSAAADDGSSTYNGTVKSFSTDNVVSTLSSTIQEDSVTFNGSLESLEGQSSVEVYFEYRLDGESEWDKTVSQTLSSTGDFSETVSLESSGRYEVRAVAGSGSEDYSKSKKLEVTGQNDQGTTQDKAQPIILRGNDFTGLDGFESGSSQLGWESVSDSNGSFSIDSNAEIYLDNSLKAAADGSGDLDATKSLNEKIDSDGKKIEFTLKIDNQTGDGSDLVIFRFKNSSGNETIEISFDGDGNIDDKDGNTLGSWSANTIIDIQAVVDFTNNEFDLIKNGSTIATNVSFTNNSSEITDIQFVTRPLSGATINTFIDNFTYTSAAEDTTNAGRDIALDWTNISGKSDIAIYDNNGNLQPFEVEELDTANETGVIWFYPSTAGSFTRDDSVQAQVVYGDGPTSSEENVTGTWDNTGQNAVMVQHLQDDPLTATDSTANNNDGTVSGATATSGGQFDGAASFDGTDDLIEIPDDADLNPSNITVVGSVNFDNLNNTQAILEKGNPDGSSTPRRYRVQYADNTSRFNWSIYDGSWTRAVWSDTNFTSGENLLFGGTYNGTQTELFVDGTSRDTASLASMPTIDGELHLGSKNAEGDEGSFLDALLDAVRVYTEAKPSAWHQADYDASPKAGQVYFSQQSAGLGKNTGDTLNFTTLSNKDQYVGRFQTPSSTGTQTITDVPFEPDVVQFIVTNTNSSFDTQNTYGGGPFGFSHGFSDAVNDTHLALCSASGSNSTNGQNSEASNSYSVNMLVTSPDGATISGRIQGYLTSTAAGEFTMQWDSTHNQQYVIYRAFKFGAGEDFEIGSFSNPSSTGTQKITTGFEPNFLMVKQSPRLTSMVDSSSDANNCGFSHGWAANQEGGTSESVQSVSMDSGNINHHVFGAFDDRILHTLWDDDSSSSIAGRVSANVDSWDTDGFTLNYTNVNPNSGSNHVALYLAVKSAKNPEVGMGLTPTSTTTQLISTNSETDDVFTAMTPTNPGINQDGVSGSNQSENTHGWVFGGINHLDSQMSMGYASNSNSVNDHRSMSSASDALKQPHTDETGSLHGVDEADISNITKSDFDLNWTQVVTSSSGTAFDQTAYTYWSLGSIGVLEATPSESLGLNDSISSDFQLVGTVELDGSPVENAEVYLVNRGVFESLTEAGTTASGTLSNSGSIDFTPKEDGYVTEASFNVSGAVNGDRVTAKITGNGGTVVEKTVDTNSDGVYTVHFSRGDYNDTPLINGDSYSLTLDASNSILETSSLTVTDSTDLYDVTSSNVHSTASNLFVYEADDPDIDSSDVTGFDETDSNGEYAIAVEKDKIYLIGVDYISGSGYYGEEKRFKFPV